MLGAVISGGGIAVLGLSETYSTAKDTQSVGGEQGS